MLKVEGIEPSRIKCSVEGGDHAVCIDGRCVALLRVNGGVSFDGEWGGGIRHDAQSVMNACIDEWRASGGKRLWPDPPPEPVRCVCGGKAAVRGYVQCVNTDCLLRANTVEEWNIIQAALKTAKESR